MTLPDNPRSNRLLIWLILLTLAALLCSLSAILFGWAVNLDTLIEMNPNGDPLVRQDAIGMRAFTWSGVAALILLLIASLAGAWRARSRGRRRLALGLSLLAAAPMFLLAATFLYFILREA